jgi:chromosome segregation ATPase
MADLEEDRRRLLDDFHKKSRELDETRSRIAALSAELEAIQGERDQALERIRALEEVARTRRSEREDVSDHPEYLARVREVESLTARADAAEADARQREAAEDELRAEGARVAEELAQAQRQVATLQARVESLLQRPATSVEVLTHPTPTTSPEAEGAVVSLLDDLAVMQAELRGVQAALAALAGLELPQAATDALGGATPVEAAEGVGELLRILGDDAARLLAARAGSDAPGDPAE